MKKNRTRREFMKQSAGGLLASSAAPWVMKTPVTQEGRLGTPAILGGTPVHKGRWPAQWPLYNEQSVFRYLGDVVKSNKWTRVSGDLTVRFEQAIAKKFGVQYCLGTNTGSSALDCAVAGCDIGPGDEVLVPAYTFISGANMPLNFYALPVLVDIELDTFQMNPKLIEERITPHTKAIMVCHYNGSAANMDAIMAIAAKHNLRVIEDACLTAIGEWRGKNLGTFGNANAISHQQSKMLPVGEGGHVMSNDQACMDRAYAWHDYGCGVDWKTGARASMRDGWQRLGLNLRMTEFQAAVGLANLEIWDDQMARRERAGKYLDQVVPMVPGISVQRHYPEATRTSYYYCLMRYDASQFHGMPVADFVEALRAEGIPATEDEARPKGDEPYAMGIFETRGFQRIFSKERIKSYRDSLNCPAAEALCKNGIIRIFGHYLLTDQSTLDAIPEALHKVQQHSATLASRARRTA